MLEKVQELWIAFKAYLSALSTSSLLLHIALSLLALLVIVYFLPLGKKTASSSTKNQASSKSSNSVHKYGSFRADDAKGKKVKESKAPQDNDGSSSFFLFRLFSKKGSSSKGNTNKLNEQLDFLAGNNEKERKKFTHPKATEHYKELIKPGYALNINGPNFDELDEVFCTMLEHGAVTRRYHLVTNFEHHYLEKLRLWFGERYHIFCQVAVGSVLKIDADVSDLSLQQRRTFAQKCNNMSFDFLLVEKGTDLIICAIELDDPTHNTTERKLRDRRLDRVCAAAKLPIFHIKQVNQKPDLSKIVKQKKNIKKALMH